MEIYIHIPFCVKKCKYCDFLSAPADKFMQDSYMSVLCEELKGRSVEYKEKIIETIFIGGGTPSVVDSKWIVEILEILFSEYHIAENAEISMEINPATVTKNDLESYYRAGINRLSIGLQSANSHELQRIGRIHDFEQFLDCYEQARSVGFGNINVDIMSALPGQTMETYRNTLEKVTLLKPAPDHISAYSLILEEGTPLKKEYEEGKLDLPDEEEERYMYDFTDLFLKKNGYYRYEISNYAHPGKECRHNKGYWERVDYLGFGIGAASKIGNKRFHNTENMKQYIAEPCDSYEDIRKLGTTEEIEETMFLGLRMTEGISMESFQKLFNVAMEDIYGNVIKKHMEDGLLIIEEREDKKFLCLTKKGMDVCNYVMSDFLEPVLF